MATHNTNDEPSIHVKRIVAGGLLALVVALLALFVYILNVAVTHHWGFVAATGKVVGVAVAGAVGCYLAGSAVLVVGPWLVDRVVAWHAHLTAGGGDEVG